jgi:hypothetical protein
MDRVHLVYASPSPVKSKLSPVQAALSRTFLPQTEPVKPKYTSPVRYYKVPEKEEETPFEQLGSRAVVAAPVARRVRTRRTGAQRREDIRLRKRRMRAEENAKWQKEDEGGDES